MIDTTITIYYVQIIKKHNFYVEMFLLLALILTHSIPEEVANNECNPQIAVTAQKEPFTFAKAE